MVAGARRLRSRRGRTGSSAMPGCAEARRRGTPSSRSTERLIYSIPLKYGATPEDAADIFQAVCIELYKELPRVRQRATTLRPWLITVTAHRAFHWKRKAERQTQRGGRRHDEAESRRTRCRQRDDRRAWSGSSTCGRRWRGCPRDAASCSDVPLLRGPGVDATTRWPRSLGLRPGSIGFIRGRCLESGSRGSSRSWASEHGEARPLRRGAVRARTASRPRPRRARGAGDSAPAPAAPRCRLVTSERLRWRRSRASTLDARTTSRGRVVGGRTPGRRRPRQGHACPRQRPLLAGQYTQARALAK